MTNITQPLKLVRFLRLPEVMALSGLKHSAIYDGIAQGTFPKPVKISARAVGWPESDIAKWAAERIAERNN